MTEKLIETQGSSLKSPITNEPMGSRLLPAVSIRNAIDALMKTSMIDGDLAEKHEDRKLVFEVKKMAAKNKIDAMRTLASWHANGSHGLPKDLTESIALVDKTDVLELEHKAIIGDSDAMFELGMLRMKGERGCEIDMKHACKWFKKSSDSKNIKGMVHAGKCLLLGSGVKKNETYGVHLMTISAEKGCPPACFALGEFFYGLYGLPKDTSEAKHWLTKALSGDVDEDGR